jgi:hypothetical protein
MRKIIIALGTFLGGIIYAAVWTKILDITFNYRQINEGEGFLLFSLMFIYFYYFGVYISAAIFRFFSKRKKYIVPSALPLLIGSLIFTFLVTLILSLFFVETSGQTFLLMLAFLFIPLSIILSLHKLVFYAAYEFEYNKSLKYFFVKIATVLLINSTLLLVVCTNDFPGVNASVEVRQEWAYKKYQPYSQIVNSIQENHDIKDKIDPIKSVAPTNGKNLFLTTEKLRADNSELTLEVVGQKGTGIAYITTYAGYISGMCFEYQGKKTRPKPWASGLSCND